MAKTTVKKGWEKEAEAAKAVIEKNKSNANYFDRLTKKQQKFILEFFSNGGCGADAARIAYNCSTDSSAYSISTETLRIPSVQRAMSEIASTTINLEGALATANNLRINATSDREKLQAAKLIIEYNLKSKHFAQPSQKNIINVQLPAPNNQSKQADYIDSDSYAVSD